MDYNTDLKNKYLAWNNDVRTNIPDFLQNEKYSNPYYIYAPDEWEDSIVKILIVGEEGSGTWGCGKADNWNYTDIDLIQKFNYNYVNSQTGKLKLYKRNDSPFWRRFRKISNYGTCCWSNIDKIHLLKNKNCKLSEIDRIALHSIGTKILQDEINILKPDIIVFFGFYGISLMHECSEVFDILYPGGLNDSSRWFKNVVPIELNNRVYIFTYHPSWGERQKEGNYEKRVMDIIEYYVKKCSTKPSYSSQ